MEKVPTIADLRVMTDFTIEHRHLLRLWRQIIEDDKRIGDEIEQLNIEIVTSTQLIKRWEKQNLKSHKVQLQQWGGVKARGNKVGSNLYKAPSNNAYQTSNSGDAAQDMSPHGFAIVRSGDIETWESDIQDKENLLELNKEDKTHPFYCPQCHTRLIKRGVSNACNPSIQQFNCPECESWYYLPVTVAETIIARLQHKKSPIKMNSRVRKSGSEKS